jgi:hypothetical protein
VRERERERELRVGLGARLPACDFERVALLNQHGSRMRHIFGSLSGTIIFFDIISQMYNFRKKITYHKMCVLIFSAVFI